MLEEEKRQRLREPLATIPERVVGEETRDIMTDDTAPPVHEETRSERINRTLLLTRVMGFQQCGSGPNWMTTGCLCVSSINALQKPSSRSDEYVVESREVHIKDLLDTGTVKDSNNEDVIKTGAKIFSGRFADDAHREKSRWCARELATSKDPSVFAGASDVDNTSLIVCWQSRGVTASCASTQWPHSVMLLKQS